MAEGTTSQDNRRFEENIRNLIKEQQERFEKEMAALKTLMVEMHLQQPQIQQQSPSQSGQGQPSSCGGSYQISTRLPRLEFPRFGGEDFKSWLYKCDQFFEIDDTPMNTKVRLAAMHLEGKALQWHQVYMKGRLTRELPSWEEYIQAVGIRFGGCLYDDPMGDLKSLKQTKSIAEYQEAFEELLNRVELPAPYAISCFLRGLREDIQLSVRMFMPRTLQHAVGLAKIQEAKILNAAKQQGRWGSRMMGSDNGGFHRTTIYEGNQNLTPILPTPVDRSSGKREPYRKSRTLSTAEIDEKRAKGLCFWCNEKYGPGHKCRKCQFYKI